MVAVAVTTKSAALIAAISGSRVAHLAFAAARARHDGPMPLYNFVAPSHFVVPCLSLSLSPSAASPS